MSSIIAQLDWTDGVGTIGTLMVMALYLATQIRFINSDDMIFPIGNFIGSGLIAFSLYFNFNFASALMEFLWISISVVGVVQGMRLRSSQ
jgi:hypothetical protein